MKDIDRFAQCDSCKAVRQGLLNNTVPYWLFLENEKEGKKKFEKK